MTKPLATLERTCPTCHGSGRVHVTSVYADTLELLRSMPDEANGAKLARLAGVEHGAMCNRLVILESLGLAEGRKYGRQRLWRAIDPPTTTGESRCP